MPISFEHAFQTSNYRLRRSNSAPENLPQEASLFSVGNGFIGIRGMMESMGSGDAGNAGSSVFLNGVYERRPVSYHEEAYGFPKVSDVRVPVLDCTGLILEIEGRDIYAAGFHKVKDSRELDYGTGILFRDVVFVKDTGETLILGLERLVSLSRRTIAAASIRVSADGFSGSITLHATISHPFENVPLQENVIADGLHDPRTGPVISANPWKMETEFYKDNTWTFLYRSNIAGIGVATMDRIIVGDGNTVYRLTPAYTDGFRQTLTLDISPGKPADLFRLSCYETDRGNNNIDVLEICRRELDRAHATGYHALSQEQAGEMVQFSAKAFVRLPEDSDMEGAVNFNSTQLFMAAGRDAASSISAKGQTGAGYEGHVFWDAEIFVLPFFVFTFPEIARGMLEYRHSMLGYAREIAATMGHSNAALYPWRTISGTECSSFFPAGTAQYHINADIAYAVQQYVEATDDLEFLSGPGIEMLVETARIWPQAGFFNHRKGGAFCLNRVTGPDEYSAIVDNNLYTNVMAKGHLEYTLAAIETIKHQSRDCHTSLLQAMNISNEEMELWGRIAANFFLPYSTEEKIYLQDEHFLEKEMWDFGATPADNYPLLLHYHPLTIYRYQVCKQADAVLAMFLKGSEFPFESKAATLKYYERITTQDSTLSPGTFAIVSAECNELEKAYEYLSKTSFIDIDDLCDNTSQGLHMAALANSWNSIVFGFGGMRSYGGVLRFNPRYSRSPGAYSFCINFRGRLIRVDVTGDQVNYHLLEGKEIDIYHGDTACGLKDRLSFDNRHTS